MYVLPTASWRFWINVAHCPAMIMLLCKEKGVRDSFLDRWHQANALGRVKLIRKLSFQSHHGERSTFPTEVHYFWPSWWEHCFLEGAKPLVVITRASYSVSGMHSRFCDFHKIQETTCSLLGSSCHIFILMK